MGGDIREKYRQFRLWQQSVPSVKPMTDEQHTCSTCGTVFVGNYCPRCSQPANLSHFSARTMLSNFIDTWGFGNRSLLRTLRDLFLRPGYLIRDYLNGKGWSYFPPFKLFFLTLAFQYFIVHRFSSVSPESLFVVDEGEELEWWMRWINEAGQYAELFFTLLFAPAIYLLFRHSPFRPTLSVTECGITMIFLISGINIVDTIFEIWPNIFTDTFIDDIFYVCYMTLVFHQLFGFSWKKTIWRTLLAVLLTFLGVALIVQMANLLINDGSLELVR